MQTKNKNCIVLILGFNRPEFVKQRVNELGANPPFRVHISIDGGISSEMQDSYADIEQDLDKRHFNISYKNTNLGLVKHVTGEISHLFERYEYVIVIEDDVQISGNFIRDVGKNLMENRNPRIATWGGYSPINKIRSLENLNCWRETHYFSAWGWGISRDHWSYYTTEIDSEKIDQELMDSKIWSQLSSFQKRVWKSRFRKVAINPNLTWDYQMQFMTFKHDFLHKLPILRLTENEGFGDTRSTNTKSERPRWMGAVGISEARIYNKSAPDFLNRILVFIDSLTISGDSILLKPKYWFKLKR